jgi:hypothetical protein
MLNRAAKYFGIAIKSSAFSRTAKKIWIANKSTAFYSAGQRRNFELQTKVLVLHFIQLFVQFAF